MKPISTEALTGLLEQTFRHLHSDNYAKGLYPAQWAALRYFAQAHPSQRTPSHFAKYQGMSLAPVARTIRTLVEKGWLRKVDASGTTGKVAIEVTDDGHQLLTHDPAKAITVALDGLPDAERAALASGLERLLRALASQ